MNVRPFRKLALLLAAAAGFVLASTAAMADPPNRVARLSYQSGSVSFSPGGDADWSQAEVNRPMFIGDRLWVDAGSRAELQLGGIALRVGEKASLAMLNIDDSIAQLQLTQGALDIRVWRMDPGQSLEIDTPNFAFVVLQPGSYRLDADAQDGSTAVTVRAGSATLYGDGRAFNVGPPDTLRFYDTKLADYGTYRSAPPDDLQKFAAARDARWEHSVSARYVAPEMIGFDDLDDNGTWRQVPDYGWAWTPARVADDWAPYREGHWAWVDPWGWTWVDEAPWGFAPFHYGRWAFVERHWCWVPGPMHVRPVYAPALVAFVGAGAGNVGWFPLGPREVYRPPYAVGRDYFSRVNMSNTSVNAAQVDNVFRSHKGPNAYMNQRVPGAVVAVPSQAFVNARPIAREAVRARAESTQPQAVVQAPVVKPVRQSVQGPQPAQHRPSDQAFNRQVVAQAQPPAAPSRTVRAPLLSAAPATPTMKMVKPVQPAAALPPPTQSANRAEREGRRDERGRPVPGAPAATPAPAAAPTPAPAAAPAPAPAAVPVRPRAPEAAPARAPVPARVPEAARTPEPQRTPEPARVREPSRVQDRAVERAPERAVDPARAPVQRPVPQAPVAPTVRPIEMAPPAQPQRQTQASPPPPQQQQQQQQREQREERKPPPPQREEDRRTQ